MKLLDKRSINTIKAFEKKTEIDEGAKLAKKIDYLRETASKEEANLKKFREESLKAVRSDIEAALLEKDSLIKEIKSLNIERKLLLIPLDSEWEKVEAEKKALDAKSNEISEKKLQLISIEKGLKDKEASLSSVTSSLKLKEISLAKSEAELLKGENKLKNAKEGWEAEKNLAQISLENALNSLKAREAGIAVKERELLMKEKRLNKKEEELVNKEIQINDQYEILAKAKAYKPRN